MATYLDHAATTSLRDEARDAWLEAASVTGNASSLHGAGRHSRRIVEESRESIAAAIRVRPSEVIFTSGGTESDNLAIKGIYWARQRSGAPRPGVITSSIEHHAVLDPVMWLRDHERAQVRLLEVDARGRVCMDDRDALVELLGRDTAVCSVMWANNEVGTVQPIAEIAELCAAARVPFHSDAVQALGQVPIDASIPGLSALTLSSHKVGGPQGVGALVARLDLGLEPVAHGGGQERDVRSGTLDVAGIAAFAAAVRIAVAEQVEFAERVTALRDELITRVRASVPSAVLNGAQDRLPNNAHFTFPGCEGDALLMLLDAAGVQVSTGSACTSGVPEPSHVLMAMGVDEVTARGSLRFTLGRSSTRADVDALVAALPAAVERAARAGTR